MKWDNITKAGLIMFFSALYFYLPISTLWYQSRGLSLTRITSLTGILIVTIFLTNVATGIFADKVGRKTSVIIAQALQLLGEILFLSSRSYPQFIIVSVIAGLGFSFLSGAFDALVYDSLKEENRQDQMKKTIGSIMATKSLATILGAAASSLLLVKLTPDRFSLAIILTIISVTISLAVCFFLKEPKKMYIHHDKTPRQLFVEAIKTIKNNHRLRKLVVLAVITTPFVSYLQSLFQPYFQLSQTPGPLFGIALSVGGTLSFLSLKYAYFFEKQIGQKWTLLVFTLLPGIFYLLMSFTFHPLMAVVLFCLNYGSMNLQEPLFIDYTNQHVSSENRATLLSTIGTISSAYLALIGPLIGKIADQSIPLAFIFMGSVVIFGALIFRINPAENTIGSSD